MSRNFMGNKTPALALIGSVLILSGCVGGTTFGTGVTQEKQLVNDLQGMMSLGTKRKAPINYAARPDLVMPPQSTTLPPPQEEVISTSNAAWPETPEQRLARIRGEAEEADPRSGAISLEEQRRQKPGLRIATGKIVNPDMNRDGFETYQQSGKKDRNRVRDLKEKYAYSTGPTRKYLTEPPVEYRTPVASAIAGDLGISEAEKEKRAEKAAKIAQQEKSGRWLE